MNARTQETEKRLAQLKRQVPTRGFERHPVFIQSLAELPPELCSPLLGEAAGQTLIVFPPQIQRGRHYVPKQALLFQPDEVTHVLASIWPGEPPQVTRIRSCNLLYAKVTLLLLYGFLEIVGRSAESPTCLAAEFNTVAWDKLAAPFRRLVEKSCGESIPPPEPRVAASHVQARRDNLPLKFYNGIRLHGLLAGETLLDLVFQPGVKERLLYLFHRAVLANTLVLLTSHFVVVIQEELKVAQGWIVTYIPRANIRGIHCQPRGQWNELSFQLNLEGQKAEVILRLNDEATQAWKAVWEDQNGEWHGPPLT